MIGLRLHNRFDAVFPAGAASVGGQASLGHPPGAALWGVAAGAAYRDPTADTFARVHSGRLRVTPAFPLIDDAPAFPWPECLLEPKHVPSATREAGRLAPAVWNTIHLAGARPGPGEGLKGWYLTPSGRVTSTDAGERGKTAVKPGERRAASGEYFQYEHLQAGQDWLAWIEGDDERAAVVALAARPLRLGRSSLQEYGGGFTVTARLPGFADPRARELSQTAPADGRLILWCLSDLACVDDWGLPNLAPTPADLGVGPFEGLLNRALSVITTRRHAPWNTWLDGPDRELATIAAGSVLVYDLRAEIDLDRFSQGCGRWRERGLGLVWPNPPILADLHPGAASSAGADGDVRSADPRLAAPGDDAPATHELQPEDQAVFALLERAADRRVVDVGRDAAARDYETRLTGALHALPPDDPRPGASQWALFAQAVEVDGHDPAALRRALVEPKTGMCARAADRDWAGLLPLIATILDEAAFDSGALAKAAWRLRKTRAGGGDG